MEIGAVKANYLIPNGHCMWFELLILAKFFGNPIFGDISVRFEFIDKILNFIFW